MKKPKTSNENSNFRKIFLKPIGTIGLKKFIPCYGRMEDEKLIIEKIPIVKEKELIIDKRTMLFPLFIFDEVYETVKKQNMIISYDDFVNTVLNENGQNLNGVFVLITQEQLEDLYKDGELVDILQDYLSSLYKPAIKRVRK